MVEIVQWVATAATVLAASMTAANLGSRITGYGFIVFLIGSIAWLATGILSGQGALVATNIILSVLNVFGIWRWLGRQAKVEEGAKSAAQSSAATPGETWFPVSRLTSAPVRWGDREVGHCVDCMAGTGSGRLAYVVFSQGGLAGVGETLRQADWSRVRVDDDHLLIDRHPTSLPQVERDEWPVHSS